MSDQIAQGQENQPVSQDQNQEEEKVSTGVQKRFDEMTARYREQERSVQEMSGNLRMLQEQNSQLMQMLMDKGPQDSSLPKPPAEIEGLDPEVKRGLDAYFAPLFSKLEAQQAELATTRMQSQVHGELISLEQLAAQQKVAAPVIEMAKQQLISFRQNGLSPKQASVATALRLAMGDYALNQLSAPPGNVGQNVPPQNWSGTSQVAPPTAPRSSGQALPAGFDSLSLDKQIAILERLDANKLPSGDW